MNLNAALKIIYSVAVAAFPLTALFMNGKVVFNSIHDADISGLLTFTGLAVGVSVIQIKGMLLKGVVFSFGFLMALAHFFATCMSPIALNDSSFSFSLMGPYLYVNFFFIFGLTGMAISSFLLFLVQASEE